MRSLRSRLLVFALFLSFSAVGCPCVRNAVNGSEGLRWWLFSNFGASRVCSEMMKRGVPLRFLPLGNAAVGRFFPEQCAVDVNDTDHTIVMRASGTGYAMLPLARRVGFACNVAVEFAPDFRMEENSMYVWGRYRRLIAQPEIRLLRVENPVVQLATQTPLGDVATLLGQGIVTSEVGRGFTVVRQDDGDDFSLGILTPPDKPARQFAPGSYRIQLATDVTEIRSGSRDYLGPFTVDGNGKALFVKLRVTGAPVDYYFVDRTMGDAWRRTYVTGTPLGPPPGPPIGYGSAILGDAIRYVSVPAGVYYIVVENRAAVPVAPFGMPLPLAEAVSLVSYSAEVGDRP